jgi:hypothetical protein
MSMLNWAEKEIEIACARELAANEDAGEYAYGVMCYNSALKAFKSLLEDEHSGCSVHITKNILVRMIDGKPLTPIEDTPDVWHECCRYKDDGATDYQCSRMSSLFKTVHADGSVTYRDINRVRVTYEANPDIFWSSGNATRIIDEMFPITMPYWPRSKGYTIFGEDFLLDPANGDYDTVGYFYAIDPDGQRIEINRYFAEKGPGPMVEIDFEEYCERKKAAHDLSGTEVTL